MIIAPPEELIRYIALDENGEWICDPNIPEQLKDLFDKFKSDYKDAQEFKKNFK